MRIIIYYIYIILRTYFVHIMSNKNLLVITEKNSLKMLGPYC